MSDPILDYETPEDAERPTPQPVGRRALVAAGTFGAAGVVGLLMRAVDLGVTEFSATVWLIMAGAGAGFASLAAFGEALFFPRNVSDRSRAFAAAAVNLLVALILLCALFWDG